MRPNTIYGICKVTGELLGDYHWQRFGVDARSVRFPGIISNGALPGGGTTDYAVEVFYEILKPGHHYTCEVPEGSYMDMMYMPDALRAAVEIMEADPKKLVHRNSFNIAAMSFCPRELFEVIKKRIPDATFDYKVDPVKAAIADSWPNKMDDSCAREEWGWKPEWDIDAMVDDMLKVIGEKQKNAAGM
jgi:nucleoside-diphosphate-sugar epimerase